MLAVRRLVASVLAAMALSCGDADNGSPARVAPEDVLSAERTLVDTSRPTPAKSGFDGAPERTLRTRVWWAPEAPRSAACSRDGCGLVVLAHGFGGSTLRFDAYARELAAEGWIVAAPTFPLTNEAAPGGHFTGLGDMVSQPGDVSFVIDELIAASRDPGDPLFGRVDGERIGVMGHSLGGATVVAATRLACCTDPRIDAVVGVAPALFLMDVFRSEPRADGPPTLSVAGANDPAVRPDLVHAFTQEIAPPRAFVALEGADHVNLVENVGEPSPLLLQNAELGAAFLAAYVAGDASALAPVADQLARAGHTVEIDP